MILNGFIGFWSCFEIQTIYLKRHVFKTNQLQKYFWCIIMIMLSKRNSQFPLIKKLYTFAK